jgi:hypothetical protein
MNDHVEVKKVPLTWAQEAYWMGFHGAQAFHDHWVVLYDKWSLPLRTPLVKLQTIIREIVADSDMMRTRFSGATEPPGQCIYSSVEVDIVLCEDAEFESCLDTARKKDFDIVTEFPYAILIGRDREFATTIGIVAHHIIVDWAGMQAIKDRLMLMLDGRPIPPTVSTQELVDGEAKADRKRSFTYWQRCVASVPNTIFPTRTQGELDEHELVQAELISSTLGQRIDDAARQHRASHTSVVIASIVRSISKLTAVPFLSMNLVVSNRMGAKRNGVLHAATVSLTTPLPTNRSYEESLFVARQALFDALRYGNVSGSDVRRIFEEEAERRSLQSNVEVTLNFLGLNDDTHLSLRRESSVVRRSIDPCSPWIMVTCSRSEGGTKISVKFSSLKISDNEALQFLASMDGFQYEDFPVDGASNLHDDLQWLEARKVWVSRYRLRRSLLSVPGVVHVEFIEPWAASVSDIGLRLYGDGSELPPTPSQLREFARFDPTCTVPTSIDFIGFLERTSKQVQPNREVDVSLIAIVRDYLPNLDLKRSFFSQGGNLLDLAPIVHRMRLAGYGGADASLFEWRSVAEALLMVQD